MAMFDRALRFPCLHYRGAPEKKNELLYFNKNPILDIIYDIYSHKNIFLGMYKHIKLLKFSFWLKSENLAMLNTP